VDRDAFFVFTPRANAPAKPDWGLIAQRPPLHHGEAPHRWQRALRQPGRHGPTL